MECLWALSCTSSFLDFYQLCPKAGTCHSFLLWFPSGIPESILSSLMMPLPPSAPSLCGSPGMQSSGTGVCREAVLCSHCQNPQRMTDLPPAEFHKPPQVTVFYPAIIPQMLSGASPQMKACSEQSSLRRRLSVSLALCGGLRHELSRDWKFAVRSSH